MKKSGSYILVIFAFSFLTNGFPTWAEEPSQIALLKKSWELAQERAWQPVDGSYIRELDKLVDTYTKSGKLEEAIAAKTERQSVVENPSNAASTEEEGVKRPPQLESLRKNWIQSRDKAALPSNAVYVREIQKLQASYLKAGQLENALAAKSELEKVGGKTNGGQNSASTSRQSKTFVGKKWTTASGTKFTFMADGTGTQANAAGREWPLKWTQGSDALITVDGWMDDQKATLYFRFTKSKEGVFGLTSEKLDKQISVK